MMSEAGNQGGKKKRSLLIGTKSVCFYTTDPATGKSVWVRDPSTGKPLSKRPLFVDEVSGCYFFVDLENGKSSILIDPGTGEPMSSEDVIWRGDPAELVQGRVAEETSQASAADEQVQAAKASAESVEQDVSTVVEEAQKEAASAQETAASVEQVEVPVQQATITEQAPVMVAQQADSAAPLAQEAPLVEQAVQPADQPTVQPAEKPAEQPAVQLAEQPVAQPAVQTAEVSTQQVQPTTQATAQVVEQPVGQPVESPAPAPTEQVVQTAPETSDRISGLAITSLVLGVAAIATSFIPIVNNGSFFVGLLGFIFALFGIHATKKGKKRGRGLAIAGVLLGIVSIVVVLATQSFYGSVLDNLQQRLLHGETPVATSNNNGSAASAPGSATASGSGSAANYSELSVGQSVTFENGLSVCVSGVQLGLKDYRSTVTEVTVTYTNLGTSNASFNSLDWKAEDANGVIRSMTFYTGDTNPLDSGALSPGGTVTGNVYFDGDIAKVYYYSSGIMQNDSDICWLIS